MNEFVASLPKSGALTQSPTLEEPTICMGYTSAHFWSRTDVTKGGERRSQEPAGPAPRTLFLGTLTGSLKASPRATCGRP